MNIVAEVVMIEEQYIKPVHITNLQCESKKIPPPEIV